jgi:hypothetical protein
MSDVEPRPVTITISAAWSRRIFGALCALVVAVPAAILAVSVPNTFANGEVADADLVNDNFNTLATAIDANTTALGGFAAHSEWFTSTVSKSSCPSPCEITTETLEFTTTQTSTVAIHFAASGHYTTDGQHAYWRVQGDMPGLPTNTCITMGGPGQWHQSCTGFHVQHGVPPGTYTLYFRVADGQTSGASGWSNANSGRRLLVEVFPEG